MAIMSESSATLLVAIYVLTLSAVGFYLIYLGSRAQFINDNAWVSRKGLDTTTERDPLRQMRDASYNLSIILVIINFFIIVLLIFNKFKISLRV